MLEPNTLLQNRYQIIRPIGKGGMGAVYQATDTRLHCTVALKETLVNDTALRKAFEREAQLLARLRHPVLPKVSDHFIEGHGQFLVMEYIPGEDLATLMSRNGDKFPSADVVQWVLRWADQLLDALEYLHSQSPPVIHRDIKPHNLKLTSRGDVILLDFGLAKGAFSQMATITAHNSIMGYTPNYAPMEQISGADPDPRSDLFALGATLYHLFTGDRPPDALSRAAVLLNKQRDPLRLASELNPQVPVPVAAVIHSALASDVSARPPSASAMRKALRDAYKRSHPVVASMPAIHGQHEAKDISQPPVGRDNPNFYQNSYPEASALSMERIPAVVTPQASPPVITNTAAPGTLLRTIATGSPVLSIAYSPDGEVLVSGNGDSTATLWRAQNGTSVRVLKGHTASVRGVAFSPNSEYLATGSEDKTVHLWQMNDGKLFQTLEMWTSPVECLGFSPDGQMLAAGGWGNSSFLWQLRNTNFTKASTLATGFVNSLAFSPDGQFVAIGCYDSRILVWRVRDGYLVRTIETRTNFILALAFSPDGETIASGGGNTAIRLWRTDDGRLVDTLEGHTNFVRSLAFSSDGEMLASGSEDRSVRLWRPMDGTHLQTLSGSGSGVTSIAFRPDGGAIAAGSHDGKMRIWQVK